MKKILLADDSITIQKVVELTFSDADYQVICVSNGALALKKIAEARPNIALLDVIMPEKNGYEVCEQIKRSPATAGIPVLLLTGTFEPFDRKRAEQAGADGHLTKPFESQALVSKVEELIARTPTVSADEGESMDIVAGGSVYRVEPGAERLRAASGGGAAAAAAPAPEPAIPMPPPGASFPETIGEEHAPEPLHPALAPPDPASGGAYIGFGEETPGVADGETIVPDRFDDGNEPGKDTARLRRGAVLPEGGRSAMPSPAGAPGGDSFSGSFETEFELKDEDAIGTAPALDEPVDLGWTAPEEAPPAETWQSDDTAESIAPTRIAAAPFAPSPGPPAAAAPATAAGGTGGLTPEAIDRIAEKVVERLSDRIVREIAWEVIPSVAEAVVRRRIRELEEKDPV